MLYYLWLSCAGWREFLSLVPIINPPFADTAGISTWCKLQRILGKVCQVVEGASTYASKNALHMSQQLLLPETGPRGTRVPPGTIHKCQF
jgi:hypothetical protein